MIVRNRATKKDHELPRVEWDNMNPKHKSLFDIINPNDEDVNIPVVGTVKKSNETHKPKNKKND
jgi:hypothetical protein